MESVHYGQTFACDVCGEIFSRKDSLHRHRVTSHTEDDFASKFECEECEGTFTRKEDLTRHKVEVHENYDEEKFEFRDCGEQFSRRDNLKLSIWYVIIVASISSQVFLHFEIFLIQ